jgi:2-phospho-L-lactate guanylyltransferase
VQATVSAFDPVTYSGAVLLDDGVQLPFGPQAWRGLELRHLRPGQRVYVQVDGAVVRAVSIMAR